MNVPFIDRIWRVRGSLALGFRQSPADAFARLDQLFQTSGTSYQIDDDTLTFTKKDPIAQDKMATFNRGTLRVVDDTDGGLLLYDLSSPTLQFCFALPFLFLGIAWLLKESRNPAFVFAGIFATLYVVGRILEPWLIRSVFRKNLGPDHLPAGEAPQV
ncbi:hypothetical protein [Novosphingobium guangzhouense]|uniref:hypothetical protein n=1 Tax=Novosphingobium guangzhouense TaxID=1850347 RepID=UPI000CCBE093|nr:hypothetical protein [Novosphingobium guangzhouense]